MKRWMMMCAVVGLLVGCSSTPKEEQKGAAVTDATPSAPTPPPKTTTTPPPSTAGVKQQALGGDPLKDPNSPLSRRSVFFDYDSNVVKDEFKPLVSAHAWRDPEAHATASSGGDGSVGSVFGGLEALSGEPGENLFHLAVADEGVQPVLIDAGDAAQNRERGRGVAHVAPLAHFEQ